RPLRPDSAVVNRYVAYSGPCSSRNPGRAADVSRSVSSTPLPVAGQWFLRVARDQPQAPVLADAGGGLGTVLRGYLGGLSGAGAGLVEHCGGHSGRFESAPPADSRCRGPGSLAEPRNATAHLAGFISQRAGAFARAGAGQPGE